MKWFAQRPRQWLTPIVAQQILLTDLTGDGRLSIYTYKLLQIFGTKVNYLCFAA